ncbi:MAG: alpha-glucan family phosphorylase [Oligoflexales bacterium]|nr:alpha-glucan family phosphorylase [Oligoflexales bacterium]
MKIYSFTVKPAIPERLAPLMDLTSNMWYAWNRDACELFKKLDPGIWKSSQRCPIYTLSHTSPERLSELANDENYISELNAIHSKFKEYMNGLTWFKKTFAKESSPTIAYFSAEFGIHESLQNYSGGLGMLAGDHVKTASDLGVPMVGVGLFYRQGYFQQYLNADGLQKELYPENDPFMLPLTLEKDSKGRPITLHLDLNDQRIQYQIWKVQVGRIPILLLDANLESNTQEAREVTRTLYDSRREIRIIQELLLGIGGVKALHALSYDPALFHINEGHSAFLILERIRYLMEENGLSFNEAKILVWSTNLFTTHTPVPAGNERFVTELSDYYLKPYCIKNRLPWEEIKKLGQEFSGESHQFFSMTALALKSSAFANGVSKLHGHVSRNMWKDLYPELPTNEIPIDYVTNGVHSWTWLTPEIKDLLLAKTHGVSTDEPDDFVLWRAADQISEHELWRIHQEKKIRLIEVIRNTMLECRSRYSVCSKELDYINHLLDPNILTIGFARRFSSYKRGNLFLRDLNQLDRIVNNPDRPVQFIIAGKAHPADNEGKEIIKNIFEIASDPRFKSKIIFVENYDANLAKHLVQGVDLWLNNPIRPQEASGTSGMKAAINGILNLSILDGWWDEAFTPEVGWAIGQREHYSNPVERDTIEGNLLYHAIEKEIAPLFYQRNHENIPWEWVQMMKRSINILGEQFNASRMLTQYLKKYYCPAIEFNESLRKNNFEKAKVIAAWYQRISSEWIQVKVVKAEMSHDVKIQTGVEVPIYATVSIGSLDPNDISVEIYHGFMDNQGQIYNGMHLEMKYLERLNGLAKFVGHINLSQGGRYGYTVRVLAKHPDLITGHLPFYIKWLD